MAKQWYVVHAYSNFEAKVKASLEEHIRLAGMEDKFGQIPVSYTHLTLPTMQ